MFKKFIFLIFIFCLTIFSDPSKYTIALNQSVLNQLPFNNKQDFDDAEHGFIATLDQGIIKSGSNIVWDLNQYNFLNSREQFIDYVNPSLLRQAELLYKSGLFKVKEKIYQVRSLDISNMTIIEGRTGIIVVDPLLSVESAKAAIELYYKHRPKKPIKAVIYTHSHVDHFGGAKGVISQEDVNGGKVKVIAPFGFTKAALEENVMAGNVMTRRSMYMYGSIITPGYNGQVSTGLGLALSNGKMSLILPTDFITATGQKMIIDGIKFEFLLAPGSEAPAEMLFFLPDLNALCAAEDATHNMHNLYTLRGAKVRDAKAWAKYLDQTIDMFGKKTSVVFAQHQWPRWGNKNVIEFLEKQRDMFKYIHDQTLRLANQGYTMTEIAEILKMPDSLSKEWYNRGYYGSLNHNVKAVYNFYLGWFSGNPSVLHKLPEVEAAKKYVEYMGGSGEVIKKAHNDYEKGNYRWTAEVLNHVVFAEPDNIEAKNLLADALEQLGFQSENATWRNFYLTGAHELKNGVKKQPISSMSSDFISTMPMLDVFDYLAIRLNGLKAAENPMKLGFVIKDKNERYLLEIKNGVLHAWANKNIVGSDIILTINRADLEAVFLGKNRLADLINTNRAHIKGDINIFIKFLRLFDAFNLWFNIVEPNVNND